MVVFYVSYVFLISLLEASAYLSYVRHLASITCRFLYSVFVYFFHVAGLFLLYKLLRGVGGSELYSYIGLFKKIDDFSYFGGVVWEGSSYLLFVSVVSEWVILIVFYFLV